MQTARYLFNAQRNKLTIACKAIHICYGLAHLSSSETPYEHAYEYLICMHMSLLLSININKRIILFRCALKNNTYFILCLSALQTITNSFRYH